MHQLKLKTTVESLDLDAVDWGLFTSSMKNCDKVASDLNATFMACVNQGLDRLETKSHMDAIRHHYCQYGAADSESAHLLHDLLDQVFGEQ